LEEQLELVKVLGVRYACVRRKIPLTLNVLEK
jgi:hypothetical protein